MWRAVQQTCDELAANVSTAKPITPMQYWRRRTDPRPYRVTAVTVTSATC